MCKIMMRKIMMKQFLPINEARCSASYVHQIYNFMLEACKISVINPLK